MILLKLFRRLRSIHGVHFVNIYFHITQIARYMAHACSHFFSCTTTTTTNNGNDDDDNNDNNNNNKATGNNN